MGHISSSSTSECMERLRSWVELWPCGQSVCVRGMLMGGRIKERGLEAGPRARLVWGNDKGTMLISWCWVEA